MQTWTGRRAQIPMHDKPWKIHITPSHLRHYLQFYSVSGMVK